MESEATLTHILPLLHNINAAATVNNDLPAFDPKNLVIKWEPISTGFISDGDMDIIFQMMFFMLNFSDNHKS